jgi:hypothetical protein
VKREKRRRDTGDKRYPHLHSKKGELRHLRYREQKYDRHPGRDKNRNTYTKHTHTQKKKKKKKKQPCRNETHRERGRRSDVRALYSESLSLCLSQRHDSCLRSWRLSVGCLRVHRYRYLCCSCVTEGVTATSNTYQVRYGWTYTCVV